MDPLELLGSWRFEREIADHRDGAHYRAEGEAFFEALADDRVRWHEHGTLRWTPLPAGGARGAAPDAAERSTPVQRTLFLVHADEASGWQVVFEDGRDFHPWMPRRGVAHECGPDLYRGALQSLAAGWSLRWDVTGPAKDYTSSTRYRRS